MLMQKVVLNSAKEILASITAPKELKSIVVLGEVYKLSFDKRNLRKVTESTQVAVDCLDGTFQIHSPELIKAIRDNDYKAVVHLTHTWEKYYGMHQLDNTEYELVRKDEFEGKDGEFLIAGLSPELLKKVRQYLWENDPMYMAKERIAYRNRRLDGEEY